MPEELNPRGRKAEEEREEIEERVLIQTDKDINGNVIREIYRNPDGSIDIVDLTKKEEKKAISEAPSAGEFEPGTLPTNKGIYTAEEVKTVLKVNRKEIELQPNKGIYTREEVLELLAFQKTL